MGAALYILPFVLKNKSNKAKGTTNPEKFFMEFVKVNKNMKIK